MFYSRYAVRELSNFTISGMGQTEFDIMDLEDQKLLEREMLTLLGLTHVPENAVHKVKRMKPSTSSSGGGIKIVLYKQLGQPSREWQPHHPSLHEGHLPQPDQGTRSSWGDA